MKYNIYSSFLNCSNIF